ncbi:MAG: AraC family transcriptional regulator [Muribaculaceae bacterium]|nr:AraC family transcriptional regulator [Muribaculaceae bacterium]
MIESLLIDLPVVACAVCTALLLMTLHRRPSAARGWLCVFFAVTTTLYLGHDFFFKRETQCLPLTDSLYATCNLLVYPLFYIYVCELTESRPHRWRHALLLILPVAMGIGIGVIYRLMSDDETTHFIDHYLYHTQAYSSFTGIERWQVGLHAAAKVLFAIEVVGVMVAGVWKIKRFNRRVEQFYANTEGRTVEPMQWLLIAFVATSVASIAANAIGRAWFVQSVWLLAIPSLGFTILLVWLAYLGMNQDFTARQLEQEALEVPTAEINFEIKPEFEPPTESEATNLAQPNVAGTVDDGSKNNDLFERIKALVVSEKLYLRPDLKVMDLTQILNSNRQYVYEAINSHTDMSFAEFINRLRIEHAEKLMRDCPDLTMAEVAERSGYHSLSSFYRNRKKFGKL